MQSTATDIFNKHCPKRKVCAPTGKPCITSPIIRKLSRAKQRAHKNKNPSWKFLSKLLSAHQKSALLSQTNNTINNTIKGTKTWWQNIKKLTGKQNNNKSSPTIFIDNNWLSNEEFCDKLNCHYLSGHSPVVFPEIPEDGIPMSVNELEIYQLLNKIDTSKATISADFPSWVTKNNSHLLCEPITHLINSILSCGKFPTLWKKAEISPLKKTKHPTSFKDLRPISLLWHICKITENVIANHLRLDTPSLPNQFAYKQSVGTTDALVKMTTDIITDLDKIDTIASRAVMLDFSKAFDRMCPSTAVRKMLLLNINPSLIALVGDFLSSRSQCVKYQGCVSSYQNSFIGVPQGTILGPLLWNIFINDLTPATNHVKYADDTTLYHSIFKNSAMVTASTTNTATLQLLTDPLQEATTYAADWSNDNQMLLNTTKSSTITFTLKKSIFVEDITIYDQPVMECSTTKLLGVTLDQHMRFSAHVDSIIEKCRPAFHAISKLRKAGVNDTSLAHFYQSRILPIITYAAPMWYPLISQCDRERLEKYQRLCLRIILPHVDDTETRLAMTGLDDINVVLGVACLKYANKVLQDVHHPLHSYTQIHRISARSGRVINAKTRTTLLSKSLFHKYL